MNAESAVGSRRGRVLALVLLTAVVAAVLAALTTVAALAGHDRFDDVVAEHPHEEGIGWVADAGVSVGCNQAGTEYCPSDTVTRAQMGTFMHRLSGNDPDTPPSVHAERADQLGGAELFAAATVDDEGNIEVESGAVDSVDHLGTGEYRIHFSEDFREGSPEFAMHGTIGAIRIAGNARTCQWQFDGNSNDSVKTSCYDNSGAPADTSHSVMFMRPVEG